MHFDHHHVMKSCMGTNNRKSGCQDKAVDLGCGLSFRPRLLLLLLVVGLLNSWDDNCTLADMGRELSLTRLVGTTSFARIHWSSRLKMKWSKNAKWLVTLNTYILGGLHDCRTLWFPSESALLAMILECNMTTWSASICEFSRYPSDFHSWHFFSHSDSLNRTWAMVPTSKRSKIRAEKGVLRYLILLPISLRKTLLPQLPVLWLLALDRLALLKFDLWVWPASDPVPGCVDTAPDADSLFLKWLLTWRSRRLCNNICKLYQISSWVLASLKRQTTKAIVMINESK